MLPADCPAIFGIPHIMTKYAVTGGHKYGKSVGNSGRCYIVSKAPFILASAPRPFKEFRKFRSASTSLVGGRKPLHFPRQIFLDSMLSPKC